MAHINPPMRIRTVRRAHMDLVEEHRILNGHYKRLMTAKSVIDNRTPRSLYTNPRKNRQLAATGAIRNRSLSPSFSEPRNRSTAARTQSRWPGMRTNEEGHHLGKSSSIHVIISPSGGSSFPSTASPFTRSGPISKSASLSHLASPNTATHAGKPIPDNGELYSHRRGSISSKYERRHMDGDITDKHFHVFDQPEKPFQPRLLLFNMTQSKLAQNPKHYQPPFWKSRLQKLRAAKLGVQPVIQTNGHAEGSCPASPDHADQATGPASSPARETFNGQYSPTVSFQLQRGKIIPNTVGHLIPGVAKTLLEPVHYSEEDSWRFMKDVTQDIISAQTSSERVLFRIFSDAVKRWRPKLPLSRMRHLLTRLMDDIQAPMEGLLSVFVDREPQTTRKDAATSTALEQGETEDWSKYDDDEYEEEVDESEEMVSFADEELDLLLKGDDIKRLKKKLEQRKVKKNSDEKRQSNVESASNYLEERESSSKEASEASSSGSSVKSRNAKTINSNSASSSSSKSDDKAEMKSLSSASTVSSKSKASLGTKSEKRNGNVELDEETVNQVSDLENDDAGIIDLKTVDSHKSKSRNWLGVKMESDKENRSSSSSSAEFHLEAAPPSNLVSDSSGPLSPAAVQRLRSREPSLSSLSISNNTDAAVADKVSLVDKDKDQQQITTSHSITTTKENTTGQRNSVWNTEAHPDRPVLAEEVRQKRESFLRKFETSDNIQISALSDDPVNTRSSGQAVGDEQEITDHAIDPAADKASRRESETSVDHDSASIPLEKDTQILASSLATATSDMDNPANDNELPSLPKPKPRRSISKASSRPATPNDKPRTGADSARQSSIEEHSVLSIRRSKESIEI